MFHKISAHQYLMPCLTLYIYCCLLTLIHQQTKEYLLAGFPTLILNFFMKMDVLFGIYKEIHDNALIVGRV